MPQRIKYRISACKKTAVYWDKNIIFTKMFYLQRQTILFPGAFGKKLKTKIKINQYPQVKNTGAKYIVPTMQ